jgi:hypothetical protein
MTDITGVYMRAPETWPFKTPTIPSKLMPSHKTYAPNNEGLVFVDPRDIATLLGLGFYLYGQSPNVNDLLAGVQGAGDSSMFLAMDGVGRTPGSGGSLSVTDGSTTVSSTTLLNLSGATVTDGGSGEADITISASVNGLTISGTETVAGTQANDSNTGVVDTSFGYRSAYHNSGDSLVSLGASSGNNNSGTNVTAIGISAARNNTGSNVIAVGPSSGVGNSGDNAILIGVSLPSNNAVASKLNIGNEIIGVMGGGDPDSPPTFQHDLKVIGNTRLSSSPPSDATANGKAGTITYDANFIYVCIADNTWKRVAIATWP